jgi:RNA polymerase sigma-70 factor (ECF subfamily)
VGLYAYEMSRVPKIDCPPPFEEIIRRHQREIMRLTLRMTNDREDALDIFQETWLRAYRAYPRVEPSLNLRPWLYRIATNLCLNHKRDKMRRGRVLVENSAAAENIHFGHDHHFDGCEDVSKLRLIIQKLPRKQKEALMMRKLGGFSYSEVGTALECSTLSARANVSQAMKKIRSGWRQL